MLTALLEFLKTAVDCSCHVILQMGKLRPGKGECLIEASALGLGSPGAQAGVADGRGRLWLQAEVNIDMMCLHCNLLAAAHTSPCTPAKKAKKQARWAWRSHLGARGCATYTQAHAVQNPRAPPVRGPGQCQAGSDCHRRQGDERSGWGSSPSSATLQQR